MTIAEAIDKIDSLKPNGYTQSEKVEWLSALDGMIKKTVIDNYEGDAVSFSGYTDDTPISTELLVGYPFDELYIYWLESKVDYSNGEFTRYNNSATRYNDTFRAFKADYNRTHMPKGKQLNYF